MNNKTIFVACDTSSLKEIKKIISQTKTKKLKIIPKFGLQFFYSKHGRRFLESFKSDYFLDIKANDIPQTALSAIDSLKDLEKFTDIILTEIKQALKRGDRVELRGFGMFTTNIQKARISRNPKTGEKVNTPEKKTIHFKMSKDLFKKLNDET